MLAVSNLCSAIGCSAESGSFRHYTQAAVNAGQSRVRIHPN